MHWPGGRFLRRRLLRRLNMFWLRVVIFIDIKGIYALQREADGKVLEYIPATVQ
jgi:hypothetical protein